MHARALQYWRRLREAGLAVGVRELAESTRTAADAAAAIGGVPPLGHTNQLPTVVDDSLRRFATVWCAAGTPNAVFEVGLAALIAAIPGDEVRAVVQA